MERFIKGDIVVIPFPFSDLSQSKKRPAFVLADLHGDDLILCQITSKMLKDEYAIEILDDDFETGNLMKESNVRINKLFTADRSIILYKVAALKDSKTQEIINGVINILSRNE
ncbi:mRNA interferase MazF [Anaerovirgula multivorans]|uniref:mRNA interferase MazF n=1 Tax=Anaerovirgula multivorans TaxID=312168 RepID=A0A239IDJ4_9FIRM|nr:type II toxin-antitoxin system PemK/MazF family toxin [Anaerovirgula multivorans]SNS91502.1 mRNA interferase MazF [Anaerovirgula multivorans]